MLRGGVSEISEGSGTDGPSKCLVSPGALTAPADEVMMLEGIWNGVLEQGKRGSGGDVEFGQMSREPAAARVT